MKKIKYMKINIIKKFTKNLTFKFLFVIIYIIY